jgi:hypothetical protein
LLVLQSSFDLFSGILPGRRGLDDPLDLSPPSRDMEKISLFNYFFHCTRGNDFVTIAKLKLVGHKQPSLSSHQVNTQSSNIRFPTSGVSKGSSGKHAGRVVLLAPSVGRIGLVFDACCPLTKDDSIRVRVSCTSSRNACFLSSRQRNSSFADLS